MKGKIFLLLLTFVLALTATSCKKDYQCTCVSTFTNGNYTFYAAAKSTKKDAQNWCSAFQSSNVQPGISTICTLN